MLSIFKKETSNVKNESVSNIKDIAYDGTNYFSDELIALDEAVSGNFFCPEKVLIERHGVLTGNITSKTCLVCGQVNGNIISLDLLDIKATAVVRGNIQSAKVNIEPGAVINGFITVGEDIEALTRQWNETRFSTDEDFTIKLSDEPLVVNMLSDAASIIVKEIDTVPSAQQGATGPQEPKVESSPVSTEHLPEWLQKESESPEKPASKPLIAASPPKKAEELANNQRWW